METDLFVCEKAAKVDKIITVDMARSEFYPLNIYLNTQIEKAWVEGQKVDLISTTHSPRGKNPSILGQIPAVC